MDNSKITDPEQKVAPMDREQQLAQAVAEFQDLEAREETVEIQEFCGRYPLLEPELHSLLETMRQVRNALEPTETSIAGSTVRTPLPERLSGYTILGEIGAGGMGRVFMARDERLDRRVAIKTLNPEFVRDEPLQKRFMQEARALARLSHPHIVQIYSLGREDELPHFVMEFVEGAPLTEAARALPMRQKAELMHRVVQAVDFLHQHRIIHRDLKPGNILVGSDLEPKVLDFGLALQVSDPAQRLTQLGEILGTPDYFSPEQSQGSTELGIRSDVFSLGTIFYQMLTDVLPFAGEHFSEKVRKIREEDPILPRRIDAGIPGELQNICMKALEKDPAQRYASAREMAADFERFLAGEPVLANPSSYARLMSGKISRHLQELRGWQQDRILSEYEFDAFRKLYERLVEREDAWIMEVRRLSLPQVSLYLGAWVLVVGAALLALFHFAKLAGTPAILLAAAATAPTAYIGIRCWNRNQLRIAVAYLLALCLLLPVLLLVAMGEWKILTQFTQGRKDLELFVSFSSLKPITHAQLWWSLLLSLPVYYWLRRFTQSSVFSLVLAFMAALLCLVTLLRMGMLEWLENDPGLVYFRLLPFAALFMAAGFALEHLGYSADSRYYYPIAVIFTFAALSGVALFHKPYAEWLQAALPITRGQIEYLFIINAGIYLTLQSICARFHSTQMRAVGKSFRFVIPGHVMTSMLLLGLIASDRWNDYSALYSSGLHRVQQSRQTAAAAKPISGAIGDDPALVKLVDGKVVIVNNDDQPWNEDSLRSEARFFEIALPLVACAFIFGSIPKQMKNFLATGLLFLAIGLVRLQQNLFKGWASWSVLLLLSGLALMLLAANYPAFRLAVHRFFRRLKSFK